jgi:hypothetical protein
MAFQLMHAIGCAPPIASEVPRPYDLTIFEMQDPLCHDKDGPCSDEEVITAQAAFAAKLSYDEYCKTYIRPNVSLHVYQDKAGVKELVSEYDCALHTRTQLNRF